MEKTVNTYEVDESPFTIIEIVEEEKFKITIRNNIISKETFKSKEEAENYINSKPWELILNSTLLMGEIMIKILNTNKK